MIGVLEGAVGVGKTLAYLIPSIVNDFDVDNIYGEEGLLSDYFYDYSPREGQMEMAKDVGELVSGVTPIVVATSSNTLLDQLIEKDLPMVQDMFDVSFAGLKGLNNYLCKRLYNEKEIFDIEVHEDGTKGDQVDWKDWVEVTTSSRECLKKNCSFFHECYYQRQRQKAMDSDVLVINHHLLAAHIHLKTKIDYSLLPEFETLIVDEAHELESSIISFFTKTLSKYVFDKVTTKFMKASNKIESNKYDDPSKIGAMSLKVNKELQSFPFEQLIKDLNEIIADNEGQLIEEEFEELDMYVGRLKSIKSLINRMEFNDKFGDYVMPPTIKSYLRYFKDIIERLEWLRDNPANIAIWIERDKIKLTNIDVSGFLNEFWDEDHTTILTSATIMVNDSADFIKDRLGIEDAFEGTYDSCYDYQKQAKLLIPKKNNPKRDEFMDLVEENIDKIIKRGYDKSLILFTSYRDMNEFVPKMKIKYDNVLSQSRNLSKKFLLKRFAELDESILIAQAASFGTGVDIKGNKNIILVKLNFDVPTDPLFVAQSQVIEENGGNPFMDLSIPNVAIRTKQQFGRSIRSKDDKAIIAILDGRLLSSYWGRMIFNSLPRVTYYDKI